MPPRKYTLKDLFGKVTRGKELTYTEAKWVKEKYLSLRQSAEAVLLQCDPAESTTIALREALRKLETKNITYEEYVGCILPLSSILADYPNGRKIRSKAKLRQLIAARMAMSGAYFLQAPSISKLKKNTRLNTELLFQMNYLADFLKAPAGRTHEGTIVPLTPA